MHNGKSKYSFNIKEAKVEKLRKTRIRSKLRYNVTEKYRLNYRMIYGHH